MPRAAGYSSLEVYAGEVVMPRAAGYVARRSNPGRDRHAQCSGVLSLIVSSSGALLQ